MNRLKSKYEKYFKSNMSNVKPQDMIISYFKGAESPDQELPGALSIHKGLGEGLSTPKLMAQYNAYNDAGSDVLSNYGSLKFVVDNKNGKPKDMTNVYLRAYDKAKKHPERYSEIPVLSDSKLDNQFTYSRRTNIPLTIDQNTLSQIGDFTKNYYIAQNERVGVEPTKRSEKVYNRTKIRKTTNKDERKFLDTEDRTLGAYTRKNLFNSASKIYLPATQRAEILRTGSLSNEQKGILAHEFSHVADNSNFSTGAITEPKIQDELNGYSRFIDIPSSKGSYDWGRSAAEFRANVPKYYLEHGLSPDTNFNDLSLDDQLDMAADLCMQQGISAENLKNVLNLLKNNFKFGGRLFKRYF